ncbi:MAG: SPOR domain-containing protein [Salinispira sp.]
MGENKVYIIIFTIVLVAVILTVAGILLFSPPRNETSEAADISFDPYSYIRREDNGLSEGASVVSVPDNPEKSAAQESPAQNPDEILVFRQQQIYGQQAGQHAGQAVSAQPQQPGQAVSAQTQQPGQQPQQPPPVYGQQQQAQQQPGQQPVYGQSVSESIQENLMRDDSDRKSEKSDNTERNITAKQNARRSSEKPVIFRTASSSAPARTSPALVHSVSSDNSPNNQNPPKTARRYWIQLIASSNQQAIMDAGETLRTMGIRGKVSTRKWNDTLYYRIRYGPFNVLEEAEKFLVWFRDIDAYAGAYISLEYNN